MSFGKSLMVLLLLFSVLGVYTFAESLNVVSADDNVTTLTTNSANILMGDFSVVICVEIKNNNDHVEYFKISQTYYQVNPNINWNVVWTDPDAVKMATNVNPTNVFSNENATTNSTGDLGWKIEAGETKKVSFKLDAVENGGPIYGYITPNDTTANTNWPLINDPGLGASWFMPNELEMLNPNLKIVNWDGTFHFRIKNVNPTDPEVQGIIRAPIVPLDSNLICTDPTATFVDTSTMFGAETAAWDVTLVPGETQSFMYEYQYPKSSNSSNGNGGNNLFPVSAANNTTTVPTQNTGVPYGLFAIAVLIVGAGLGYAKFLR